MVNLVIMRHGEAVAQSSQDSQRQLNARGEAEVSQMAQWLTQVYPQFDYVLASPYVRTQQTAELMLAQQGNTTQLQTLPAAWHFVVQILAGSNNHRIIRKVNVANSLFNL